jgi:hypothetical protein
LEIPIKIAERVKVRKDLWTIKIISIRSSNAAETRRFLFIEKDVRIMYVIN